MRYKYVEKQWFDWETLACPLFEDESQENELLGSWRTEPPSGLVHVGCTSICVPECAGTFHQLAARAGKSTRVLRTTSCLNLGELLLNGYTDQA